MDKWLVPSTRYGMAEYQARIENANLDPLTWLEAMSAMVRGQVFECAPEVYNYIFDMVKNMVLLPKINRPVHWPV